MKRKSIAGFVLGLISFLIMLPICYYILVTIMLINSLTTGLGTAENTANNVIINIILSLEIVGSLLIIVGACYCFNKARIGGIHMLIGSVLLAIFPIYIFIVDNSMKEFVIIMAIPIIFSLIGGICAVCAKAKQSNLTQNNQPQTYPNSDSNLNANLNASAQNFCKYCGAKLKGDFCSNCGAKND